MNSDRIAPTQALHGPCHLRPRQAGYVGKSPVTQHHRQFTRAAPAGHDQQLPARREPLRRRLATAGGRGQYLVVAGNFGLGDDS